MVLPTNVELEVELKEQTTNSDRMKTSDLVCVHFRKCISVLVVVWYQSTAHMLVLPKKRVTACAWRDMSLSQLLAPGTAVV